MARFDNQLPRRMTLAAALAGSVALAAMGCVEVADIDHIVFGTAGAGGTGATGGGGTGGASSSCTDGTQNGQETGVDCGGPDCPPCAEDCTNGVDDNGDNLVDCADPICDGYTCVPPVPAGWSGPVAFYLGSDQPPACDPAWPQSTELNAGELFAPASCSDCTCSAPTGGTCYGPILELWDNSTCGSGSGIGPDYEEYFGLGPDACHNWSSAGGAESYGSAMSTAFYEDGSFCASGGGVPDGPTSWSQTALVCEGAEAGGGCGTADELCVRTPTAPFDPSLCITQAGDVSCPDGSYSEKHVVYGGVNDNRACSECSCGFAQGVTCQGHVWVYASLNCTDGETEVSTNHSTCTSLSNGEIYSAKYTITGGPTGGSCEPQGGNPAGSASPAEPVTVCCLP